MTKTWRKSPVGIANRKLLCVSTVIPSKAKQNTTSQDSRQSKNVETTIRSLFAKNESLETSGMWISVLSVAPCVSVAVVVQQKQGS